MRPQCKTLKFPIATIIEKLSKLPKLIETITLVWLGHSHMATATAEELTGEDRWLKTSATFQLKESSLVFVEARINKFVRKLYLFNVLFGYLSIFLGNMMPEDIVL